MFCEKNAFKRASLTKRAGTEFVCEDLSFKGFRPGNTMPQVWL